MPDSLDATVVRSWCGLALEALGKAREGIDAINVYPIADGDTGTNLYFTAESAAHAVEAVFAAHTAMAAAPGSDTAAGASPPAGMPTLSEALRAMAHGALIGARGNSGTILAQLLRGMTEILAAGPGAGTGTGTGTGSRSAAGPGPGDAVAVDAAGPPDAGGPVGAAGPVDAPRGDGELLRLALRRAADAAYQAVAHPVEGTVLTVAAAAADAAERAEGGAGAVARAAHAGACAALDATPDQLTVLARAGVVDAGGCGLVTVLGALVEALTGEAPRGTGLHRPRSGVRYGDPDPDPVAAPGAELSGDRDRDRDGDRDGDGDGGGYAYGNAGHAGDPEQPGNTEHPGDTHAAASPYAAAGVPDAAGNGTGGRPGEKSPAYEVIYLLEAADEAVPALRSRLDALGDSLVVVGGDGLWNVHVHVDDAGAAVEAGIEAGRPHRIRITHFGADCATGPAALSRSAAATGRGAAGTGAVPPGAGRAVAAVVPGDGLAALCREAGATVVTARPGEPPAAGELVDAVRRTGAREVVLLPNDPALRHTAAAAAEQARAEGVRVAVIPTRSAVQGIAALAVHEPGRRFDEDVVAMTSAAGATRCAELAVAEHQSWTSAGICQAGDVLGLIDGDVAVIGQELADTAESVLDRMLAAGGEMVTLVLGAGVPDALADHLETRVRNGHLAVDTVVYRGGQASVPLLIGVE